MNDFGGKRFDDRILDREDDGSAFERFVDEFISLEVPESRLVRGLARGADGAIDLVDTSYRIKQIVECKFIGANTKSTAEERWGEVRRHLADNLIPLAQGNKNRRKKYRPWLRSEGDLETYTFVTSAICASADERNKLREAISSFFRDLSHKHGELRHLADVKVDLRYWDDLVGQSAFFAPLYYRWFGGFPQGFGEISGSFGAETGFKQFLANRNLPYFSRDLYLSETKQRPVSEFDTILKFLTEGNDARARVIFGPGGVGKTRLSIELCEKAREVGWWPIRLDRKASVAELDTICQTHASTAKLLLFIDYAEAFEELDQLHEAVARLASDGKHRISILASTRSSSLQRVIDRLNDLQPEVTNLSPEKDRDDYTDWLVGKIIHHLEIPQSEQVAKSCRGLPVMAAFAGFLFQRDRTQFDLQFGNLASINDFSGWSSVRLKAIEDRFPDQPVQSLLAELAVRLPIPQTEVNAFRHDTDLKREIFDILKADRWIEVENEAYSAAHDVLADAILARHLFAVPGIEQDRVQDIAVAAMKEGHLDRCMAALDRLGDHPVFERLSGKALVEALMASNGEKTLEVLPSLIKTRLLSPAELIALLASSDVLRARLANAPEAHLTLARAGEWAATKGQALIDRASAELALNQALDSAVAYQHPSNMVLRYAHAFDSARFYDEVLRRVLAAPSALDTHYLIVSLLKHGRPPEDVSSHLESWLERNSKATKASFVYRAWLDAGGDVEAVREKLLLWVEEHSTATEAQFVYRAWLDAGGDVEAVREKLLLWVEEHGTAIEAGFVYKAWLGAGGDVEAVREKLLLWVEEHSTTTDAPFVYRAWLDAGGDVEAVREKLLLWVEEHGTAIEAQFVYKAWLDAGGDVEAVREKLLLWVEEHSTATEAQFVYQAWLDAGGDVEAVREKLLLWVEEHGTAIEACFVYKAWLDAGGDVEAVREKLPLWVVEHGTATEAQFVYKAWLNAGGDVEAVREKLLLWVEDHGTAPEADFVYKAWLDADLPYEEIQSQCQEWFLVNWKLETAVFVTKALSSRSDLPLDIVARIVAWAGLYAKHEDAIFRLSRVSRVISNSMLPQSFIDIFKKSILIVFEHILYKRTLSESEQNTCAILFGNLVKTKNSANVLWLAILEIYCSCLRHGSILRNFQGMPSGTWVILLHDALIEGLLDPIKDRVAVNHAHKLVQDAVSPEDYADFLKYKYLSPPAK
ncbi:hypothetical protein KUV57_24725 [Epibacterium sp. DP7N7-1]|nr:hypothetical protein [Epibacterium sp. DP7N7-1]